MPDTRRALASSNRDVFRNEHRLTCAVKHCQEQLTHSDTQSLDIWTSGLSLIWLLEPAGDELKKKKLWMTHIWTAEENKMYYPKKNRKLSKTLKEPQVMLKMTESGLFWFMGPAAVGPTQHSQRRREIYQYKQTAEERRRKQMNKWLCFPPGGRQSGWLLGWMVVRLIAWSFVPLKRRRRWKGLEQTKGGSGWK